MSLLIKLAITVACYLTIKLINHLMEIWNMSNTLELPESETIEFEEYDKQKIFETQKLIKEYFGNKPAETIAKLKNKERIALYTDFAEKLAQCYELDIDTDVTICDANTYGYYDWNTKTAQFNVNILMQDKSNPRFELYVRESIDTIVHELRHAVQHKAILNPGFWNISEEQRLAWAKNMAYGNYISPNVDLNGYKSQPVEKDAFSFAGTVMKGVD